MLFSLMTKLLTGVWAGVLASVIVCICSWLHEVCPVFSERKVFEGVWCVRCRDSNII